MRYNKMHREIKEVIIMHNTEKNKMTTGQILFGILFAILGILNILYGISIYLIHSGSKFYAVWFGIGFLFFILSAKG